MSSDDTHQLQEKINDLESSLLKQEKTIAALKERVKLSIRSSGDAYGIFENNIILHDLVAKQTKTLQEAILKAEAGSKAKSDFLAKMSHEIRTPLNVISGMAYLLSKTNLNTQQLNYINNIQKSSQTLLGIINDVLDVSKVEAGKMVLENIDFSIYSVLENLINIFGVKSEDKKIEVLFSIDPDIPKTLVGDPLRLAQILNNLCSNAIKFTTEGEILLKVEIVELKNNAVSLQFSIKDTGIGIKPEQTKNLFQVFSQADNSVSRKYGGSGLGLSICKHMIKLMDGKVGLDSTPGVGSTFFFTITFPIKDNQHECSSHVPKKIRNKNILIIDDNPTSIEIFKEILNKYGFKTESATSGKQAIELIKNNSAKQFDVVFIDYSMPEINGCQTIEKIKAQCEPEATPSFVLMVSGNDINEATAKSEIIGIEKIMIKPFMPMMIIDAIVSISLPDSYDSDYPLSLNLQSENKHVSFNKKFSVLVVDDSELNIQVISAIIKKLGIAVFSAKSGKEAIDKLNKNHFDMVFMDIQMPEMDGLEATRIIRTNEKFKDLPILAITAHAMKHDAAKSFEAGMNEHLTKPIDPVKLEQTIVKILTEKHGKEILNLDRKTNKNKPVKQGNYREQNQYASFNNN